MWQAINAYGVAKVVVSGNPEFEKGDLVVGFFSWGEYCIVKPGGMIRKFDSMGFPLSYQVGVLGNQLIILIDLSHQIS